MTSRLLRIGGFLVGGVILLTLLLAYAVLCSYAYVAPSLPSVESMRKVEMQVPLRVYSRSGDLIAQIGEQRRIPVVFEKIPGVLKKAFLAAEDDRFYEHHGIDYVGVMRAIFVNVVTGKPSQGASTITMQAARNMFLVLDKTWRRKLQETFLTYRMERAFSKNEIFGLYLNKIFFGQRAYGVAAAAETFFGKSLDQLTVAEAATIAGVAQLPSRYNPVTSPRLASMRRTYVLRRMNELGFIDNVTAAAALKEPMTGRAYAPLFEVEAPYVAEMARLALRERFGPTAESAGYKVYTTIDGRLQTAANRAVRIGLIEYDRRHGWRGALGRSEGAVTEVSADKLDPALEEYSRAGALSPALVTSVEGRTAGVWVKGSGAAKIGWEGLSWARRVQRDSMGPAPTTAQDVLSPGDVVYVVVTAPGVAQLAQLPDAQSALIALDPHDGAITSLVGGFDYFINKYNRVTQARRLPGSGFKPFLYSAALENGFTPATVLLDAPVVLEGEGMEASWRPENSTGDFHGPTRLREALVRSRNLVSIRLLRAMGTAVAIDYVTRFGFAREAIPENLTMALGTMQATPLEIATGYAVFANGGYRVQPYFIDRIENAAGKVIWHAAPRAVCETCEPSDQVAERVITPQNDWLMTDMMADVIRRGTGHRAMELGRTDLAGKTGTTNDTKDAWFNGFTPNLVASVWVGFDQERSLGASEEGAKAALPIWMQFMREALRGVPQKMRERPEGLVTLRISRETGRLAADGDADAIPETFIVDKLPVGASPGDEEASHNADEPSSGEPIF